MSGDSAGHSAPSQYQAELLIYYEGSERGGSQLFRADAYRGDEGPLYLERICRQFYEDKEAEFIEDELHRFSQNELNFLNLADDETKQQRVAATYHGLSSMTEGLRRLVRQSDLLSALTENSEPSRDQVHKLSNGKTIIETMLDLEIVEGIEGAYYRPREYDTPDKYAEELREAPEPLRPFLAIIYEVQDWGAPSTDI